MATQIRGEKVGGVREEGEEKREERDRRRGGEESKRNHQLVLCAELLMWGRRHSRFCWEAFIAHEKASCLLKSYLQSAARLEGRRGSLGPHRAGDCGVERVRRTRTIYWLSQGPQSPEGKGFFCISRRFHPWSPQTASPGRCLYEHLSLCLLSRALSWHPYSSLWR